MRCRAVLRCIVCCGVITSGVILAFPREKKICSLEDLHKLVSNLPTQDRFELDYFFRTLIQEDSAGYVMGHAKPMVVFSYLDPNHSLRRNYRYGNISTTKAFLAKFKSRDSLFQKSLETWRKYEKRFPGSNLSFEQIRVCDPGNGKCFKELFLINKALLFNTIAENFSEFKELGFSRPEEVLQAIVSNEKSRQQIFSHHKHLGICLGYGAVNAKLFSQLATIMKKCGQYGNQAPWKQGIKEDPKVSFERNELEKRLAFSQPKTVSLSVIRSVGFRCDHSLHETQALLSNYRRAHKFLSQHFQEGQFLEKALALYMQENSHDSLSSPPAEGAR
ncbi:MAG: hypothetical protein JSS61_05960 [Verrucomicrobia bacterium]|nr:hypothetical protein [Verrucomicrobiota bacterium]